MTVKISLGRCGHGVGEVPWGKIEISGSQGKKWSCEEITMWWLGDVDTVWGTDLIYEQWEQFMAGPGAIANIIH